MNPSASGLHALGTILAWDWLGNFRWIFWGVIAAGAAVIFIGFPLLIFLVALFEKLRIAEMVKIPEREMSPKDRAAWNVAVRLGFRPLGMYSDGDKGLTEGIVSLLLSPDGHELVWMRHSKVAGRTQVMTRLADGRWLATASITGSTDLSGLLEEQILPEADVPVLLYCHRQRVAQADLPVVPFTPETVVRGFYEAHLERARQMIGAGLARWIGDAQEKYRFTPAGAARLAAGQFRTAVQLSSSRKLAEQKKREWEQFGGGRAITAGATGG